MIQRLRSRRGQGLAELVLSIPLLLVIALGILEVSRMIETVYVMSTLTREGANVAARGASLAQASQVTRSNQAAAGLGTAGGVVVSRIEVDEGEPFVVEQVALGDPAPATRVGLPDSIARPYLNGDLREGQEYHVVELVVPYRSATPFERIFRTFGREELYDRALF